MDFSSSDSGWPGNGSSHSSIPSIQNAIIGEDNSVTGGLIGATTLLALNYVVVRFLYSHPALDRSVEGGADVLIEGGVVRRDRLKGELITLPELQAAAHRQGFGSLEEVERAVLEPSGTLSFVAKTPPVEATRHQEIASRLDGIARDILAIRASLATGKG